jgi:aminodeoxyfutalosine deaminase
MQIYAASYLLPVNAPPIAGGALAVHHGRIAAVGTLAEVRRACSGTVREFPDCIIMPGLVNPHTHLELTHFPAWKLRKGIDYSPRTYVDWVIQVIKIRRALTADELVHSVREGIRKSLESGTTMIGDILSAGSLAALYHASPFSGRLYREALGQDPARCGALLKELDDALEAFPEGKLKPGLSPHAPHTLSARFMQDVVALARAKGVPTMIHLAESPEEVQFLYDTSGGIADLLYPFAGWENFLPAPRHTSPVAYLDGLGVLDSSTTVVHAVQVSPDDAHILKRRSVSVILCPRSNDRLVVGKAPVALLKKAGIPLALGTDSLASNDSLSMWDEMRFLLREFPDHFTPAEVLEMATLGAARALRCENEGGSLEPGKRADFLVVKPSRLPGPDAITGEVIEESHLENIYLAGEPLVEEVTGRI